MTSIRTGISLFVISLHRVVLHLIHSTSTTGYLLDVNCNCCFGRWEGCRHALNAEGCRDFLDPGCIKSANEVLLLSPTAFFSSALSQISPAFAQALFAGCIMESLRSVFLRQLHHRFFRCRREEDFYKTRDSDISDDRTGEEARCWLSPSRTVCLQIGACSLPAGVFFPCIRKVTASSKVNGLHHNTEQAGAFAFTYLWAI